MSRGRQRAALPIGADTPRGVEADFSRFGNARVSSAASVGPSAGHPPPRSRPRSLKSCACRERAECLRAPFGSALVSPLSSLVACAKRVCACVSRFVPFVRSLAHSAATRTQFSSLECPPRSTRAPYTRPRGQSFSGGSPIFSTRSDVASRRRRNVLVTITGEPRGACCSRRFAATGRVRVPPCRRRRRRRCSTTLVSAVRRHPLLD